MSQPLISCDAGNILSKSEYACTTGTLGTATSTKSYSYGNVTYSQSSEIRNDPVAVTTQPVDFCGVSGDTGGCTGFDIPLFYSRL